MTRHVPRTRSPFGATCSISTVASEVWMSSMMNSRSFMNCAGAGQGRGVAGAEGSRRLAWALLAAPRTRLGGQAAGVAGLVLLVANGYAHVEDRGAPDIGHDVGCLCKHRADARPFEPPGPWCAAKGAVTGRCSRRCKYEASLRPETTRGGLHGPRRMSMQVPAPLRRVVVTDDRDGQLPPRCHGGRGQTPSPVPPSRPLSS